MREYRRGKALGDNGRETSEIHASRNGFVWVSMKIRTALNSDEVKRILEVLGQNRGRPDYLLIFKLMVFERFKVGEIVGSAKRKYVNRKWIPKPQTLPGMRVEDLIENGIKIKPRGKEPLTRVFQYPEILQDLREFIGERQHGRIFPLVTSESRVLQIAKEYAGPKHANLSMSDFVILQMFVDFSRNLKHENLMQLLGFEFTAEQLVRLIQKGEGLDLEFKRELSGHYSEFCETMVSFANLHGGNILIGVEDNRAINGVPESQLPKLDDIITNISHDYCDPFIPHSLRSVPINDTQVAVVQIDEGTNKPYWLKDRGPILRTGQHHGDARDRLMTRQETEQAFRRYSQNSSC